MDRELAVALLDLGATLFLSALLLLLVALGMRGWRRRLGLVLLLGAGLSACTPPLGPEATPCVTDMECGA